MEYILNTVAAVHDTAASWYIGREISPLADRLARDAQQNAQAVIHPGPRAQPVHQDHAHAQQVQRAQPQQRREHGRLSHEQRLLHFRDDPFNVYREPADPCTPSAGRMPSYESGCTRLIWKYRPQAGTHSGIIELEIFDWSEEHANVSEIHRIPADQCPALARYLGCDESELPEKLVRHQLTIESLIDDLAKHVRLEGPFVADPDFYSSSSADR